MIVEAYRRRRGSSRRDDGEGAVGLLAGDEQAHDRVRGRDGVDFARVGGDGVGFMWFGRGLGEAWNRHCGVICW